MKPAPTKPTATKPTTTTKPNTTTKPTTTTSPNPFPNTKFKKIPLTPQLSTLFKQKQKQVANIIGIEGVVKFKIDAVFEFDDKEGKSIYFHLTNQTEKAQYSACLYWPKGKQEKDVVIQMAEIEHNLPF